MQLFFYAAVKLTEMEYEGMAYATNYNENYHNVYEPWQAFRDNRGQWRARINNGLSFKFTSKKTLRRFSIMTKNKDGAPKKFEIGAGNCDGYALRTIYEVNNRGG